MPEAVKNEFQAPAVTDERSAAAVIEKGGLFSTISDDDAPAPPSGDDESDIESEELASSDTAPDEEPASDEGEDGQPEGEDHPIEAPKSWSAKEKEAFSELPPDVQSIIARREGERDRGISQKLNEIAQERQHFSQAQQAANQQAQQYAANINQLLDLTIPQVREFDKVDWQRLSVEDPSEYVRLTAARDALRSRVQAMANESQRINANQQQQQVQAYQQFLGQQHAELLSKVPEFAEPEKARKMVNDISNTLASYGFTAEELNAVSDHRIVRVMADLARLSKGEKSRLAAQAKRGGAPAPRVMQSGASQPREPNSARVLQDQFARLQRTGSDRDAAKILENLF